MASNEDAMESGDWDDFELEFEKAFEEHDREEGEKARQAKIAADALAEKIFEDADRDRKIAMRNFAKPKKNPDAKQFNNPAASDSSSSAVPSSSSQIPSFDTFSSTGGPSSTRNTPSAQEKQGPPASSAESQSSDTLSQYPEGLASSSLLPSTKSKIPIFIPFIGYAPFLDDKGAGASNQARAAIQLATSMVTTSQPTCVQSAAYSNVSHLPPTSNEQSNVPAEQKMLKAATRHIPINPNTISQPAATSQAMNAQNGHNTSPFMSSYDNITQQVPFTSDSSSTAVMSTSKIEARMGEVPGDTTNDVDAPSAQVQQGTPIPGQVSNSNNSSQSPTPPSSTVSITTGQPSTTQAPATAPATPPSTTISRQEEEAIFTFGAMQEARYLKEKAMRRAKERAPTWNADATFSSTIKQADLVLLANSATYSQPDLDLATARANLKAALKISLDELLDAFRPASSNNTSSTAISPNILALPSTTLSPPIQTSPEPVFSMNTSVTDTGANIAAQKVTSALPAGTSSGPRNNYTQHDFNLGGILSSSAPGANAQFSANTSFTSSDFVNGQNFNTQQAPIHSVTSITNTHNKNSDLSFGGIWPSSAFTPNNISSGSIDINRDPAGTFEFNFTPTFNNSQASTVSIQSPVFNNSSSPNKLGNENHQSTASNYDEMMAEPVGGDMRNQQQFIVSTCDRESEMVMESKIQEPTFFLPEVEISSVDSHEISMLDLSDGIDHVVNEQKPNFDTESKSISHVQAVQTSAESVIPASNIDCNPSSFKIDFIETGSEATEACPNSGDSASIINVFKPFSEPTAATYNVVDDSGEIFEDVPLTKNMVIQEQSKIRGEEMATVVEDEILAVNLEIKVHAREADVEEKILEDKPESIVALPQNDDIEDCTLLETVAAKMDTKSDSMEIESSEIQVEVEGKCTGNIIFMGSFSDSPIPTKEEEDISKEEDIFEEDDTSEIRGLFHETANVLEVVTRFDNVTILPRELPQASPAENSQLQQMEIEQLRQSLREKEDEVDGLKKKVDSLEKRIKLYAKVDAKSKKYDDAFRLVSSRQPRVPTIQRKDATKREQATPELGFSPLVVQETSPSDDLNLSNFESMRQTQVAQPELPAGPSQELVSSPLMFQEVLPLDDLDLSNVENIDQTQNLRNQQQPSQTRDSSTQTSFDLTDAQFAIMEAQILMEPPLGLPGAEVISTNETADDDALTNLFSLWHQTKQVLSPLFTSRVLLFIIGVLLVLSSIASRYSSLTPGSTMSANTSTSVPEWEAIFKNDSMLTSSNFSYVEEPTITTAPTIMQPDSESDYSFKESSYTEPEDQEIRVHHEQVDSEQPTQWTEGGDTPNKNPSGSSSARHSVFEAAAKADENSPIFTGDAFTILGIELSQKFSSCHGPLLEVLLV